MFSQAAAPAPPPDKPLFGLPYTPALDPKSMDRSVDPCTDFYRYSCGEWILSNPIPPDQARWDVYAKLENDNEKFLWGLLQDAAKPAPGRNAVETEIGDFFTACMDEAGAEKAGLTPLQPELDAIAALKSTRDIASFLGRQHLALSSGGMMFGFDSGQDYADASQVIAFAEAGGLGLPDRDYYVKTDAKSVETRQKYLDHVQKMLELLGEPAAQAQAHAQTVMAMETALAKVSLTRVDQRDPHKLFHKLTPAAASGTDAVVPLERLFRLRAGSEASDDQRHRAGVLQGAGEPAQIARH